MGMGDGGILNEKRQYIKGQGKKLAKKEEKCGKQ